MCPLHGQYTCLIYFKLTVGLCTMSSMQSEFPRHAKQKTFTHNQNFKLANRIRPTGDPDVGTESNANHVTPRLKLFSWLLLP